MASKTNVAKAAKMADSMMEEVEVPAAQITTPPELEPEEVEMPETKKTNGKTASKKAPIPRMAKFLPEAESVKIYKRELGQRRYIKTYSSRDVARAGDIETFIQTYLMPVAGEGDYDVDVYNAKGDNTRTIPVSVLDPDKPKAGLTPTTVAETKALDVLLDRMQLLEQQAQKPSKSFAEQLQEVAQVKGMLGMDDEKKGGGMGMMEMMMLMKMFQEDKKPSVSPELAELRAEIRYLKEKADEPPPPPLAPLPPPMPLPNPTEGLAEVVKAVVESNKRENEASIRDLIPLLQPKPSMSATEIVAVIASAAPLVKELFGNKPNPEMDYLKDTIRDMKSQLTQSGSKGIKDTLEDVTAIMGLARNFSGGQDDNFWSFANKLVDNGGEFVDSISNMVDSMREKEKEERRSESQTRGNKSSGRDAPDDDDEVGLNFPPEFEKYVGKIEEAKDGPAKVGAVLIAFQFLGQSDPRWRKYLTQVINLARKGDQDEVMEFLVSFLEALQERKMLSEDTVKSTIETVEKNWDQVVAQLAGSKKKDD